MKNIVPVIVGIAAIVSAIGTAIANANGLLAGHAHWVPRLYALSAVLFVAALVIGIYNSQREQKLKPLVVPLRYGPSPLQAGKHTMGHYGLIVANHGEPAYDVSVLTNEVQVGTSKLLFEGCKSTFTKADGDAFFGAVVERSPHSHIMGSALFDEMSKQGVDDITVELIYKDAEIRWYKTIGKIERNVSETGGLSVKYVQQERMRRPTAHVHGWRWLRNVFRSGPKNELPTVPIARPAEETQDGRPLLRSLPPRICFVAESEDGCGFAEGGDSLRAVVAAFRMYEPSADPRGTQVIARVSYRTKSDFGIRETFEEVYRANQGMWLDEGFNSIEFTLTDTKELILAVEGEGKCIAIQDNRHSVNKFKQPSVYEFTKAVDEFFVDVTLVDEFYGSIITYTYKIEVKPLKVSEILRVPAKAY